MIWVYAGVGLAVAGLVPLVLLGVRVVVAARRLADEIERATSRLEPVQARLDAVIGASRRREG
ncbi:hypothetical protein [Sphaerisporangium sp. TRM90804]|uniref:hypothetical protein n=1 Tax=Sphaerisporangium sp. TRM90804 TaxID=3031113 RepID=UPI002447E78F|nr:hypothetical protein [Sphaerisporangium sp. TRM90804]MDH2430647.1 hypothetical protein [Sphaerisporangium sp. TRM90804]